MIELKGKCNVAKVFTDNVDSTTISQIIELCNQESMRESQIRIMPDCHAGAGCVIGTTMTLHDKVVPNLVGVDIGCIDKDSEILTPNGWIKISEYNNEQILVYSKDDGTAFFDKPYAYIKQHCDTFYHFKHDKGLDQMLSEEHKMLLWRGYANKGYVQSIDTAKSVFNKHNSHTKSNFAIKTTFDFEQSPLSYSDNFIRILIMISADGRVRHNANNTYHVELHFKKQRKIDRARMLLSNEKINYYNSQREDGTTYIAFTTNIPISKSLTQFYSASKEQLAIIIDELYHWDGTIDVERNHKFYSTTNKANADFIQFALATNSIRAGIQNYTPTTENWNEQYLVYQTNNEYVGFPNRKFNTVQSIDGFKYCFTTSTGFFIMRRNDNISITGNCGMLSIKLQEHDIDLPLLDECIKQYVPSGFNIHETAISKSLADKIIAPADVEKAFKSLGTLGGGNHFIEVDKDSNDNLWLVVHTGSRHLGIEVCNYYQDKAYTALKDTVANGSLKELTDKTIAELKAQHRESEISKSIQRIKEQYNMANPNTPKELAYLTGQDFADYIHDMKLAQQHAAINRRTIAEIIIKYMDLHPMDDYEGESYFDTIHNYIDTDNMILRKGAISAQNGERILIPMNMRDGSLICIGKGNPDWNYSAPHGAGRILSRSKAKDNVSMEEFTESMKGIYSSSVCESTIDESPMAYKPMDEIIQNIKDTVDIVDIIKPIYNFKAH